MEELTGGPQDDTPGLGRVLVAEANYAWRDA
jgi:hypothetical protein